MSLAHLFIPHPHNNHKPRLLHNLHLFVLILLFLGLQFSIKFISLNKPQVLGYASFIPASEIIRLTNNVRAQRSLPPLKENSILTQAAFNKAKHMFKYNYWSHNAPDGTEPWFFITSAGYSYQHAGENLARDFTTAGGVVSAWQASPTHMANLISPKYKDIGVAVVDGKLNGVETTLVVQMLGSTQLTQPQITSSSVQNSTPLTSQSSVLALQTNQRPLTSPFDVSRSLSLAFIILILATLAIDWFVVWQNKIIRISAKSWAHITFLSSILIIIVILKQGQLL